MARLVTYLTCFCLCICPTFAAAAKEGAMNLVDLGAKVSDEPLTYVQAMQALDALVYASHGEKDYNAVNVCENGKEGLRDQFKIMAQAELDAAATPEDQHQRLLALRAEYYEKLIRCIQQAGQHEKVRNAINAALASAKSEGVLEEDPVSILRKQKSSIQALLSALANATEPAAEERQALAGAAQNTINHIDAVLSAAASDGGTASDAFKAAVAALNAVMEDGNSSHGLIQKAVRASRKKPLSKFDEATKDNSADTVIELLSEAMVSGLAEDAPKRRLLAEAESKGKAATKAKNKWGFLHYHHRHHNHHRHHQHTPTYGSNNGLTARNAAFLASTAYKGTSDIDKLLSEAKGDYAGWSKVDFYSDNWAVFGYSYTEGLQYYIAKRENLNGKKWAAVSFRGSTSVGDWLGNLNVGTTNVGPGGAHSGFVGQWNAGGSRILSQLKTLKSQGFSNILITGHSLGGGVSWVATYFIKSDGDLSSANVETVTFAAPSPGDASFVNWVTDNARIPNHNHIVYNEDVVPCVPPTWWPFSYERPSTVQHYSSRSEEGLTSGSRKFDCWGCVSVSDHSMSNYCHVLGAHCPAACAGAALSGLYQTCPQG